MTPLSPTPLTELRGTCEHGSTVGVCGKCEEEIEAAFSKSLSENDTGCFSVFELEEKP